MKVFVKVGEGLFCAVCNRVCAGENGFSPFFPSCFLLRFASFVFGMAFLVMVDKHEVRI